MKFLTILLFIFLIYSAFGQSKQDTINNLEKLTNVYLTKMYVNQNFDEASKMWDKRMFLEMEDFYKKREQGQFRDTALSKRIKADVTKYFSHLGMFKVGKILGHYLESDERFTVGQIFFEYTETLRDKPETIKSILIFLSEDKGKTWFIQDWKIKDISDKVDKKIF